MERSEQINEIAAALSKAQGVIIPASKASDNPFFKSKYADLASVWEVARDPLYKNGLSITQHPSADGNIVTVETILTHSSGQWLASKLTMVAKDAGPQAIGSCITYIRRYALSSIVGIASEEDDDGNNATIVKGKNDEVQPPKGVKSMRLFAEEMAIQKLGSLDNYKIWRTVNNLPENLDGLKELDYAQIFTKLKALSAGQTIPLSQGK